ncbi:MAG: hypothetical protein JST59_01870 [Actinobacteria bacterium]|nr:hypothetical protein [Actinomycetota bacterium]
MLVGTHLDCAEADPSQREVSREDAENWLKNENLDLFFETSSKNNINVAKAFEETGNQLFLNYIKTRANSTARTDIL